MPLQYEIVILGAPATGKTWLLSRFYLTAVPPEDMYDATFNDVYKKTYTVDHQPCKLHITEIGGYHSDEAWVEPIIRRAQAFIIMYSVVDRESFDMVPAFCEMIKQVNGDSAVVLIVGSMSDLATKRVIPFETGQKLAETLDCGFSEASAKMDEGIDNPFISIVRDLRRRTQ